MGHSAYICNLVHKLTTPNEYVAYALGYRLVVVVTGSARSMHFSERSRSLYAVARPSVCRLSVALVRPIQAVEIFGNIFTAFCTLTIR